MKILIDIGHPAHINFFKTAIDQLKKEGNKIKITVLRRGKLPIIAQNELKEFDLQFVGKHRGSKWSIIFEANVLKFFVLFWICIKFRPDIGLSAGSFILGAILKIFRKPNIQFDDDPERKINVILEKLTSTKLYFPVFYEKINKRVGRYEALKEWSYLAPKYFNLNENILEYYNLKPKQYIFVREVSTGSFNYMGQNCNLIAPISHLFPTNFKVVISLEDKSSLKQYPSDWVILKEPVDAIHSLIYYSKCVISSGDSMAREGAMLGVPSIYCGFREMKANDVMIAKGMLFKKRSEDVPGFLSEIIEGKVKVENQDQFRNKLAAEWIDVNKFILKLILKHEN